MQAKIFAIIVTTLLAGSAEAVPGMFSKRCCCFKNGGARDPKISCIISPWTGPSCPSGDRDCTQPIF